MTTTVAKGETEIPSWHLVDAAGLTLGRLATELAIRLRGKHKPNYTPHVNMGDVMVVVNTDKITVTGNKAENKMYHHHTGYPGGIKSESFNSLQARQPVRVLEKAVKGMLPKGPLGREMFRKLKAYAGSEHPHAAQNPTPMVFNKEGSK